MVIKIERLNSKVSNREIKAFINDFGETKLLLRTGDQAFVKFKDRENAIHSIYQLNGLFYRGSILKASRSFLLSLFL